MHYVLSQTIMPCAEEIWQHEAHSTRGYTLYGHLYSVHKMCKFTYKPQQYQ